MPETLRKGLTKEDADGLARIIRTVHKEGVEVARRSINGYTVYLGWLYHYPIVPGNETSRDGCLGLFLRVLMHHNEPQMVFDALLKPGEAVDNLADALLQLDADQNHNPFDEEEIP